MNLNTKPKYLQIKPRRQRTIVYFCGHTFEVEGWYERGRPAEFYEKNGEPGHPADPSDLFDATIRLKVGNYRAPDMTDILSDHALEKILDLARANMDDPDYDAELEDLGEIL
jgi:hypothetical protein